MSNLQQDAEFMRLLIGQSIHDDDAAIEEAINIIRDMESKAPENTIRNLAAMAYGRMCLIDALHHVGLLTDDQQDALAETEGVIFGARVALAGE